MKIDKMTTAALKKALEERGLSTAGSKGDLELRLRQDLLEKEEDLDTYELMDNSTGTQPENSSVSNHITMEQLTSLISNLNDSIKGQFQTQSEEFKDLLKNTNTRISTLESDFVGLADNYKSLETRVEDLEKNQIETNEKLVNFKGEVQNQLKQFETKISKSVGTVRTGSSLESSGITSFPMDPRLLKDSLMEFHGRLEECPATFLKSTELLLCRANIPAEIYLQMVTQQLKGAAGTWWHNIKGLSLDWDQFKKEFIQKFDSEAVRASIHKKFLTDWGIEHWTTPIYHPQANPTERRNQELKKLFRIHLLDKEHTKWDQHLHESLLAIRQRVNRVTGFSPAELFLGRSIKRTGDWNFIGRDNMVVNPTLWNEENQREVQRRNRQAEERTRREAYQIDKTEEDFEPGDQVLRRNHPQSNKLQKFHAGMAPKWLGPFEVEKRLGTGVYLLRSDPPIKVHASELKALPRPLRADKDADEEDHSDQPDKPPSETTKTTVGSKEDQRRRQREILPRDQQEDDVSFMNRYNLRPRKIRNVQ